MNLRTLRLKLNLSQSHLSRLSGVSRFKLCQHELGGKLLSPDELAGVELAIRREAERLIRDVSGFSRLANTAGVLEQATA
jgi:transcriptional regulator with XRE-family HTH domain